MAMIGFDSMVRKMKSSVGVDMNDQPRRYWTELCSMDGNNEKLPFEENIHRGYYNMPLSFGGRGAEIIKVQFEDVTRTVNPDTGETKILIKYQRTKQAGVPEMSEAMITGKLEVDILIAYESKFPKTERTGRYFQK